MPHKAYFVIADITGYTAFLTGSELDHAQDILKTLFNALHTNIKPPLIISNYQGDAILTYAPEGSFIEGQTLLETIENIYIGFAQTLERMKNNTTCTCKACANMDRLDLKLFVHYGEYVFQEMPGRTELSGADVIIAHRMMKNEVKEKTGLKAYTLFSKAAVDGLGLQDFTCEMKDHSETYEHIGEVPMYAYCLKTMWEREREKRRVRLTPQEAWLMVEADVPAPPSVVWDYLNVPELRRRSIGSYGMTKSGLTKGRTGVGSIYHCAHSETTGSDTLIVDWKPFDYMTEDLHGLPLNLTNRATTELKATVDGGTHIRWMMTKPTSSSTPVRLLLPLIAPVFKRFFAGAYKTMGKNMQAAIQEDITSRKLTVAPPALEPAAAMG